MVSRMFCGLLLVLACSGIVFAKKYTLTPATIVPGAAGELDVGNDKNGNTEVKVKVRHLAKPEGLTPAKRRLLNIGAFGN